MFVVCVCLQCMFVVSMHLQCVFVICVNIVEYVNYDLCVYVVYNVCVCVRVCVLIFWGCRIYEI